MTFSKSLGKISHKFENLGGNPALKSKVPTAITQFEQRQSPSILAMDNKKNQKPYFSVIVILLLGTFKSKTSLNQATYLRSGNK